MPNSITLTQFLIEQQRKINTASGDFTLLINDIASACKKIAHLVNRGGLTDVLGSSESENVQGEVQKKLDIISHEIIQKSLNWTGHLAGMVSEEIEDIIQIPAEYPQGKYLVMFDPLDGSSNIDVNLTVGTIFSILRRSEINSSLQTTDFLRAGTEQVCAGFVLYGPATMMILTTGQGVNGFTLDPDIGEFKLTNPQMKIAADTQEFAINLSNQRFWDPAMQQYITECLQGTTGVREKDFNMRWLASLVAETYRILTRGGVFMYPADARNPAQAGRLRLLYEANPIAFIIEQAGGLCSTGRQRMLELQPTDIHQRVPVIFGAKHEVERLESYYKTHDLT